MTTATARWTRLSFGAELNRQKAEVPTRARRAAPPAWREGASETETSALEKETALLVVDDAAMKALVASAAHRAPQGRSEAEHGAACVSAHASPLHRAHAGVHATGQGRTPRRAPRRRVVALSALPVCRAAGASAPSPSAPSPAARLQGTDVVEPSMDSGCEAEGRVAVGEQSDIGPREGCTGTPVAPNLSVSDAQHSRFASRQNE
jgi:hypothetical protein